MKTHYLIDLANYNHWADTVAIGWLEQITDEQWTRAIVSSFSSIQQTALHIVSAQKVWIDFWEQRPNPIFLSSEFRGSKSDLLKIWRETSLEMKNFTERFPEDRLDQQIVFRYPRGGEGRMPFWQTLSHIVNHSTYHRGQLVTLLRQAGFTSFSSTDLATYYQIAATLQTQERHATVRVG